LERRGRRYDFGSADNSRCVSLLGRVWQLEDIDDVESLCRTLAGDVDARLNPNEYDDLLAYLVSSTWEIHRRWDRERTPSFAQYATYLLRFRIVEHTRQTRGRTHWRWSGNIVIEHKPRQFLSLDAPVGEGNRLVDVVAEIASDPAPDWNPNLERILAQSDSQRARDLDALGLEDVERVA
jgi:hypothetical protein